ncbi:ribosome silencing factor [Bacillota bacterium LX-D]|nr:ribosome silencing factor [Bacillota bacterium LX-D]
MEIQDKVSLIVQALYDKKGVDIVALKLQGLTLVADYFIIASGRSTNQVQALAKNVMDELGKSEIKELRVEGYREGRWVLLDYSDVVVHIFLDEARQFYGLERLWGDAEHVQLTFDN